MSPRTADQNDLLRAASRRRLLTAALELFARHGYERTTVRQIAREAGVAQGLLYNYFAGKADLLRAIFEQGQADVAASFAAAEDGATPADQLERLIRHSFATVRDRLAFWKLTYSLRHQPAVLADLAGDIGGWTGTIRGHLEALLAALGVPEPGVEAALLFAQIDGLCQHYALDPDRYPLADLEAALIQRYTGLRPGERQHVKGERPHGSHAHLLPPTCTRPVATQEPNHESTGLV